MGPIQFPAQPLVRNDPPQTSGGIRADAGTAPRPEERDAPAAQPVKESRETATGLTPEEENTVAKLRARDAEVRRHEQAHAAVGGQYAGSPSYTYQTGPDGQRYAIGGEVPIDVSPIKGDAQATISKMEVVKAAALAPAEPSGADRRVASLADSIRAQAVADLFRERAATARGDGPDEGVLADLPMVSALPESAPAMDRRA